MSKNNLTAETLKSLFHYDSETGFFTRRVVANGKWKVGSKAGYVNQKGYVVIHVLGYAYYAHRLAWLYVHGEFPSLHIDHIDGVKDNNKIENLRKVTNSENMQNRKAGNRCSKSSLLGVSPNGSKWVANITLNGRITYLGLFETKELAHQKYVEAKKRLHKVFIV